MSEKNRLASTRWEALSKEEKKNLRIFRKPTSFLMSQSFPKRIRKNSSIDIGGSYWQRFDKIKFLLLAFKLMIHHGSENQQSFDTDSSPVIFLEPLQWCARCDGKVEHLVMTRALNLVRN